MAKTVFTGWRKVTPGECADCGFDDGWDCDGRGNVYCECECCPECHEFDGHHHSCPELNDCEPFEEDTYDSNYEDMP